MEQKDTSQKTLLFIPDISGFTQFVNSTEISHSQHIIAELLESIIEANQIGLTVAEIEGDAIFFYKTGEVSAEAIAEQSKKMFIAFQQQIKRYDLLRICNCGACSGANALTIKIVAHQGDVSFMKVMNQEKPFGSDVILIHRLLKNEIPHHEYLLMTESILAGASQKLRQADWVNFTKGESTYDVGKVNYHYSDFKALYNHIPDPAKPEVKVYRVKKPVFYSTEIQAPMKAVYSGLISLKNRGEILPGVLRVEIQDEKHNQINKIGTVHNCIREPDQGPAMTTNVALSESKMIFTETALTRPMSFDYIVEKLDEHSSRLTFGVHMIMKFPSNILFNLFMKKKIDGLMYSSLEKIKKYSEENFTGSAHEEHALDGHTH